MKTRTHGGTRTGAGAPEGNTNAKGHTGAGGRPPQTIRLNVREAIRFHNLLSLHPNGDTRDCETIERLARFIKRTQPNLK